MCLNNQLQFKDRPSPERNVAINGQIHQNHKKLHDFGICEKKSHQNHLSKC